MSTLVRIARAALPAVAAVLCAKVLVRSLSSGATIRPGRGSMITRGAIRVAEEPSQFWFMQCLLAVGVLAFAWLAWREFRK